MPTTNIFIGSSSKAIPLAKALAEYLRGEFKQAVDIREWYDEYKFRPSETILTGLDTQARQCSFAILLLTKDDFARKHDEEMDVPRDNTIFEMGLFVGELGIDHCFMVCSADEKALPSDLRGYKYLRIDPPQDLSKYKDVHNCILNGVGPQIRNAIRDTESCEHRTLPVISRDELCERERATKHGGQLLIVPSNTTIVVNSVEPVELDDPPFCCTVLNNILAGAQYEYYYGEFWKNIGLTANFVWNIATAQLSKDDLPVKDNLEVVRKNLVKMQKNLSIHFRRRPPLQFCVHNAAYEKKAVCYLRCHGKHSKDFVRWAENEEATKIAEELRISCKEPAREAAIFHSTHDFELDKPAVLNAIKEVFPDDLPADFYLELNQRCIGA